MTRHRFRSLLLMCAGITSLVAARSVAAQTMADRLRAQVIPSVQPSLAKFYERRGYRPAWVGDSGPTARAGEVFARIDSAATHGLDPSRYPRTRLRRLLTQPHPDSLARLELLLSRTALAYGSDLSRGRVSPAAVDSPWTRSLPTLDLVAALETAADSSDPAAVLNALAPPQAGYARLRSALARYRDLAARGGWPRLARGVQPAELRARLALESDLGVDTGVVADTALVSAVRRFQARHGLDPDGDVGPATLAALNVPVGARIQQIELNLERWRWLPRDLGERYVMVNGAAATLEVVDHDRTVMRMRTVVGRPDWPTPIVSSSIAAVVFRPVWDIPRNIAVKEILPILRRDTGYLARQRIQVFHDSGGVTRQLKPSDVDWQALTESTFNVQLRQQPGPENPLGGVKLALGTRFNVALHDTPAQALFLQGSRTFSHGCVRLEDAAALAAYVLADSARWADDSVRAKMAADSEETVVLSRPIAAHLTYWTAWVDEDGTVEFRRDAYAWDKRLAAALAGRALPR